MENGLTIEIIEGMEILERGEMPLRALRSLSFFTTEAQRAQRRWSRRVFTTEEWRKD